LRGGHSKRVFSGEYLSKRKLLKKSSKKKVPGWKSEKVVMWEDREKGEGDPQRNGYLTGRKIRKT